MLFLYIKTYILYMKYLKHFNTFNDGKSTICENISVILSGDKIDMGCLNEGETHIINESGDLCPNTKVCLSSTQFKINCGIYGKNLSSDTVYDPEYIMYIKRITDIENHKYTGRNKQNIKFEQNNIFFKETNGIKKAYYFIQCVADLVDAIITPFDVKNMYVMEAANDALFDSDNTYSNNRNYTISVQEPYNDQYIYDIYKHLNNTGELLLNGPYEFSMIEPIVPYIGNNWRDANIYLNIFDSYNPEENLVSWKRPSDVFSNGYIIDKGTIMNFMPPYCTGCMDENGRDYWDFWSGKYIILESVDNPELFNDIVITENETYNIIGNPTFHDITINNINPGDVYFDANNQVMAKFNNHFDSYTLRPTDFIIKIK